MQNQIRIYLAGPLFTQAEWQWNERLAQELRRSLLEVILPQRRAEPMLLGSQTFNAKIIFQESMRDIVPCTAVVAILDGADADSGTCWECGYAYKLGCPILGVRTDIRASGDDPNAATNLMLSMCCASLLIVPPSIRNDITWVANQISESLRRMIGTPG